MEIPKQAAILCGGLGTRLRPLTNKVPKPLVPVNGDPLMKYQLEQLKDNGITHVVLMTGYLGGKIREHFGSGKMLGIKIDYSHGPAAWETGRRLFEAKAFLDEHFLILYGDNFVPFNLRKAAKFYNEQGKLLSFIVQPKEKGNIRMGKDGVIQVYDKTRTAKNLGFVELGYMIANKKIFEYYTDKNVSFSDIIKSLVEVGQVVGMPVLDAYYSISDMERLKLAEKYLTPKKILLIDRDGVINEKAPRGEYVGSWDTFSFIPENIKGMKRLSLAGYAFIVISNQAGIARGVVTAEAVDAIHQKMRETLEKEGIRILDIYLCPHHWDEKCFCRKPEPGLFFAASRKWFLRLDKTFFIGDDPRDCQAAYRAGCGCVYTGKREDLKDLPPEQQPRYIVRNLAEAAPYLEKT